MTFFLRASSFLRHSFVIRHFPLSFLRASSFLRHSSFGLRHFHHSAFVIFPIRHFPHA